MNLASFPWIKILLSLLAGAAIWWIYATKLEWTESVEIRPFSKTARDNPLLASSRLLIEFGYDSEQLKDTRTFTLDKLGHDDVIWLLHADAVTDARAIEKLTSWVLSGGHLMIGIDEPLSTNWKNSLEQLSVRVKNETRFETRSATKLTFRPEKDVQAITVEFEPGLDLYPTSLHTTGVRRVVLNPQGERPFAMLQVEPGDGVLTVLSDPTIFDNQRLNDYDNASLLLRFLTIRDLATIHYHTGERYVAGLLRAVWQRFPITVLSVCIALLAWVCFVGARLGPVRHETEPGRANLISHLRARGHFWRRRRNLMPLSEPVKQAVLRDLKRYYRLPATGDNLPDSVLKQLARSTGSSEQQIRRVLSNQTYSESELANAANLLQSISNSVLPRSQKTTRFSP